MIFKISRTHLLSALNKVSRAISLKTPLPILTGIKFELNDDSLTLTGSDSDITIKTVMSKEKDVLEIHETGGIVLSGKYINEIIKKIDSHMILFEIIDGTLIRIKGDRADFNINGFKLSDYPKIDLSKTGETFSIDSFELKKLINQTIFASSDKETRPVLTGLNFKAYDMMIECTATDSYRLARKVITLDRDIQFNVTVPSESLKKISQIIDEDEPISLYVSDRKLLVCLEGATILTRLIDGAFPEMSKLIPTMFTHTLSLDSRELTNAIDRASLISSESNHVVNLVASSDSIVISSQSQEIGSVSEQMNGLFEGNQLNISFSSRFVIDAVRAVGGSNILISFTGEMQPFIIKNINDDSLIQLVLPVRTM